MDSTLTIFGKTFRLGFLLRALAIIMTATVILSVLSFLLENRRLDAISVVPKADFTLTFGENAKISDALESLQGELVEDAVIDVDELGSTDIEFEYINIHGRKRTGRVTVNVTDQTAPRIYGNSSYTVYRGYTGDLTDLMLSGDDYDDHPIREILGDYDLNTIGSYPLQYVITDASGNHSAQNFTLNVIDPPKTSSGSPSTATAPKLLLADVIAQHKTDQTKIGIDVSAWQGEIDWPTVKAAGVEFAFIRIGYQVGYGGEYVLDRYFEANLAGAKSVGLPIGVYFYSYADSIDQATAQANWIIQQLNGRELELGIAFDWEDWSNFNQTGMSFRTINKVANAYLDTISAAGYQGSLYGSKNYMTFIWEPEEYPVWLAQYYDFVTYDGEYWIWQMSSSGQVPGINSNVDLDIMYLE